MNKSIIIAGVVFFSAVSSRATDQLDQSVLVPGIYGSFGLINSQFQQAQVFTVGKTGLLSHIVFNLQEDYGTTQNLLVDVRRVTGTLAPVEADAPVLASASIPAGAVPITGLNPSFVSVDLSAANLAVTPNEVLAVVLRSDEAASHYAWHSSDQGQNIYSGGSSFSRNQFTGGVWLSSDSYAPTDFAFQTYVSDTRAAPEPSCMMYCACAGLLLRRRLRRR